MTRLHPRIGFAVAAAAGVAFAIALVAACKAEPDTPDGTEVTEATCNACLDNHYSADECTAWGTAAGCTTATFVEAIANCNNGCSFAHCKTPPACGAAADASADAADASDGS